MLDQKWRQQNQDNDPEQAKFIQLLTGLSDGIISETQWRWLMRTRTPSALGPDFERFQRDAHYLCSTNAKVDSRNVAKLKRLNTPIFQVTAINSTSNARRFSSDNFRGIENISYFCVNAKISFTTNLNKDFGLVNGAPGVIRDVVWADSKTPNVDLPAFIVVECPSYEGPPFFLEEEKKTWIPISPCTFTDDSFQFTRTGYPLRLAYAMTIHKAQGESLSPIIAHIGMTARLQTHL
jgi:hypothetical protein